MYLTINCETALLESKIGVLYEKLPILNIHDKGMFAFSRGRFTG